MKKLITLIILISSTSIFALTSSVELNQFCEDRKDPLFVKDQARDVTNLMSFRNRGGIVSGGVCWWHSRFQRKALYLTYFNPFLAKPDFSSALKIIRKIRNGNEVIEVPGFNNFEEFSKHFANEIQNELEMWQRFESYRFTWVRGLRGSTIVSSQFMKVLMDELYQETEVAGNISYQKLQMRGVSAHAWLVLNMKKLSDGYDLEIIDSNKPNMTMFYQYRIGDTHLMYRNKVPFTPYLERTQEMAMIGNVIKAACNPI